MTKISGVIISFNEEKKIGRCIQSLQRICDEILVVDSFSTDDTCQIAMNMGAKILKHTFEGHIQQKNWAMEQASFDMILSLDADEELSQELQQSVLEIKNSAMADAYKFNRLTQYVDKWIYHCDWYPDTKIRLWNRKKGQWGGVNPHDLIIMNIDSKIEKLQGNILHYSYESISDHISQTNKFTTIAARAAFNNGKRSSFIKVLTRPFLKFLKDYFLRLGFLDGKYGFIICYINALSAMLKYSKLKELQDGKEI